MSWECKNSVSSCMKKRQRSRSSQRNDLGRCPFRSGLSSEHFMELFRVINDSDLIARPGKSVVLAGPSGEGCRADIYRFLNVNRLPQSEEKTGHTADKYRNVGCRSIFHADCGSFFFSLQQCSKLSERTRQTGKVLEIGV